MVREGHGVETGMEAIHLLLMESVHRSRRNPVRCQRDGFGALRREVGPGARREAAPGVPFIHPLNDATRERAARALADHCRFCGACEMALRDD